MASVRVTLARGSDAPGADARGRTVTALAETENDMRAGARVGETSDPAAGSSKSLCFLVSALGGREPTGRELTASSSPCNRLVTGVAVPGGHAARSGRSGARRGG
jgi:hypothetical protein